MKADYTYPAIADRRSPREWEADGARDIREVARRRVREVLAAHHPKPFNDQIDVKLRANYDILLSRSEVGRA